MTGSLLLFEKIARSATNVGKPSEREIAEGVHAFDERNIHPAIADVSRNLFDDGHYAQATFEAFKLIDNQVKVASGIEETGFSLMMAAFNETNPIARLNRLNTMSDRDEQRGFRYMFAGSMAGIRNPRGHDNRADPIDLCLDHLSVASVLLRAFDQRIGP